MRHNFISSYLVSYLSESRIIRLINITRIYSDAVRIVSSNALYFLYATARTGSQNFETGNFDVEDAPRSGRPIEADKDTIKALIDANRRITIREIGERLNLSNSTIYDHLKGLSLNSKLDIWVPHLLTERNLCRRVEVCDLLLKRYENDPFLKRIIIVDEK
ncbi:histone-lysine N-methyltransferase SETMAR-like [Vespa crabro]|uniref:histone-lysine N-methyltransferase SETMAR-like n=1 Tax=Vespa crabro TaxID=7445 RepID=UPI001F0317C2|nr:histone-lysine N-methyltransferase SETMAR-like [Vespa crabro]